MSWKKFVDNIYNWLGTKQFYVFILAFFAFEAIWIACSAVYPQAFDESFHFGLIQLYSHYWLPFLNKQPADTYIFGAVTRDPSYLYHYLMSFPYRLIAQFIHNQAYQVVILRLLDIAMFLVGLVLSHRILIKICASQRMANIILFIFILIPVVPLLAGQLNYDDLLFPLVGWVCLLSFQIIDEIKAHKLRSSLLIKLLIICLFASLVMYAFLPIFLGIVLYLMFLVIKTNRHKLKKFISSFINNLRKESALTKIVLLIFLVISFGMFMQRDGVNLIKYHDISPDCIKVLPIQACSQYYVWEHDYASHQYVLSNPHSVSNNPLYYVAQWTYWMWYRSFFIVNGPDSSYINYPPLPLPAAGAIILVLLSLGAMIKWRKKLIKHSPYIVFLLFISGLYIVALFVDGYSAYRYTDVLELMNGRYLIPIILLVAAVAGSALSFSLHRVKPYKELIILLILFLFLNGGGFFTYISRSDDSWYWPNSAVQKVNHAAKKITKPVIVKGNKTYDSSFWFFN